MNSPVVPPDSADPPSACWSGDERQRVVCVSTLRANSLCMTPAVVRTTHARRRRPALVTRNDVDDAADRVGAVQRRTLRTANHFDAIDRVRREAADEQRIRDLDAVDIDLRIAQPERARAANAGVRAQHARRRLRPAPDARHVGVEAPESVPCSPARAGVRSTRSVRRSARARAPPHRASRDDDAIEHADRARHVRRSAARCCDWRARGESDLIAADADRGDVRARHQSARTSPDRDGCSRRGRRRDRAEATRALYDRRSLAIAATRSSASRSESAFACTVTGRSSGAGQRAAGLADGSLALELQPRDCAADGRAKKSAARTPIDRATIHAEESITAPWPIRDSSESSHCRPDARSEHRASAQ